MGRLLNMTYSDELKELLQSNERIVSVWFDKDGEDWYTAPTVGCKEISRDEILGTKKDKK